jgi:hypothetical protein
MICFAYQSSRVVLQQYCEKAVIRVFSHSPLVGLVSKCVFRISKDAKQLCRVVGEATCEIVALLLPHQPHRQPLNTEKKATSTKQSKNQTRSYFQERLCQQLAFVHVTQHDSAQLRHDIVGKQVRPVHRGLGHNTSIIRTKFLTKKSFYTKLQTSEEVTFSLPFQNSILPSDLLVLTLVRPPVETILSTHVLPLPC